MSNTNLLLDENVPKLLKKFLESKGHSAWYAPKGTKNGKLASLALEEESILLTRDSDFLNSVLFPPSQFHGIIVLTIHPPKAEKLIKGLGPLLDSVKEFKGKLFVIDEEGYEVSEGG